LSDQFPQTFSHRDPRPLKVGIHADVLTALGDAVQALDLGFALRAYTSNTRYLGALSAGASRIDLEGKPAGTVTAEDEMVAKRRLVESTKHAGPLANVPPSGQIGPEPSAVPPPAEVVWDDNRPWASRSLPPKTAGAFRCRVG
jgi:ProP effector